MTALGKHDVLSQYYGAEVSLIARNAHEEPGVCMVLLVMAYFHTYIEYQSVRNHHLQMECMLDRMMDLSTNKER